MNPFLFLLIAIKNKIIYTMKLPNILFPKMLLSKMPSKDNLLDGYDNRQNFSILDQYILEEYIINSQKYELLKKLQTTNLSMLDKLYYIENYGTYHNTLVYTYALGVQNLLGGGLQEEFNNF